MKNNTIILYCLRYSKEIKIFYCIVEKTIEAFDIYNQYIK